MQRVNWGVGLMMEMQELGCKFVVHAGRLYYRDTAVAGGSVCMCVTRGQRWL
jgi:hypothetical protein